MHRSTGSGLQAPSLMSADRHHGSSLYLFIARHPTRAAECSGSTSASAYDSGARP